MNQPGNLSDEARTVLDDLERSLREQRDLDAVARETMLRHFEAALKDTPQGGAVPGGWVGPDPQAWQDTLQMLQREQVIGAGELDDLQASFQRAMSGLQNETLRAASDVAAHGGMDAQAWQSARRVQAEQAAKVTSAPASSERPAQLANAFDRPARRPRNG